MRRYPKNICLDEILSVAGHLQALVNGNKRQSLAAGKINFALNQLIHGTCMDIVVKHNGSVALENALGLILGVTLHVPLM